MTPHAEPAGGDRTAATHRAAAVCAAVGIERLTVFDHQRRQIRRFQPDVVVTFGYDGRDADGLEAAAPDAWAPGRVCPSGT
jgi:hypothetical protein